MNKYVQYILAAIVLAFLVTISIIATSSPHSGTHVPDQTQTVNWWHCGEKCMVIV